jgi:putative ABC transport system substrate-binding protein
MRRFLLCISAAALAVAGIASGAFAEDVLVVLSIKTTGYQEILKSVQASCENASIKVVNLSENTELNLPQLVRSSRAKVVIALGDNAYKSATVSVQRIPVIGVLVADQNSKAISYLAPPEKYLALMKKLGRKQVGIIYGSQLSPYVGKAAEMAKTYGITLVRREASSPSEAIDQFSSLKGLVDALWILPDNSVLTAGSAEKMLKSAQDFNIPVIAFSSNYLKSGAAVVIEPDRNMIGKGLGEYICSILNVTHTPRQIEMYKEIGNEFVFNRLRLPRSVFFN